MHETWSIGHKGGILFKKKKGFLTDLLERQVTFALHKETYKSDFTSHLITIRKIVFI